MMIDKKIKRLLAIRDYAFAALVVLVSALLSAILIWHKLGRLNMVAVLKTKE